MKKSIFTFVLLLMMGFVFGQNQPENNTSETSQTTVTEITELNRFNSYIGISGGYLFKNKDIAKDPMWLLENGQFAELNLGTRGNLFGWSLALGYLKMDRKSPNDITIWLNNRGAYESGPTGAKPNEVMAGLDERAISFGPETIDTTASKPFRGFYALTGPNIWIGDGKLQFNGALEGGIGYVQPGFYYVAGRVKDAGVAPLEAEDPFGSVSDYDLSVRGVQYQQFGMTQKYYDDIISGSGGLNTREPYVITPMARLSANLEYFVTPRLSIHGGANFWYVFSPKMMGEQTVTGGAMYTNTATNTIDYGHDFKYKESYNKKDLSNISVNVGLKYWFGKSKTRKVVKTTEEKTNKLEEIAAQQPKKVLVTVVDKLTKTPMGDVEVALKSGEDEVFGKTKENGVVEFQEVEAGNYELSGEVYGIETSKAAIEKTEFVDNPSVVRATLYYDDPRFILKGVAINSGNGEVEEGVKVSLEKGSQKVSQSTSKSDGNFNFLLGTNSDYQIQGLKNGYYSNTERVSTVGLKRSQTLYVTLKIGMDEVEVGKSFVIQNILYDFDDAAIRPDAALELDRLAAFLRENSGVRIELSSHTDSRGNAAYNMQLSQRRAQSAVDYLVSKGINRARLVAKGYGETRLLNGCTDGTSCSEDQHQQNRRTEIEILED